MNLKIGGSNVGKIMYNGQEFGGATKLEPGTILYICLADYTDYDDGLFKPNSTVKITFPNLGKHWEGLKKIRIYYKQNNEAMDTGQVFDVNLIDKPTQGRGGNYEIYRERGLTDEADKLIVKTADSYSDIFIIEAA